MNNQTTQYNILITASFHNLRSLSRRHTVLPPSVLHMYRPIYYSSGTCADDHCIEWPTAKVDEVIFGQTSSSSSRSLLWSSSSTFAFRLLCLDGMKDLHWTLFRHTCKHRVFGICFSYMSLLRTLNRFIAFWRSPPIDFGWVLIRKDSSHGDGPTIVRTI